MSSNFLLQRLPERAAVFAVLSLSVLNPALAFDPSRIGQPGAIESILVAKSPAVWAPKIPVPPEDPNKHYPVPGSAEALSRAKTPWIFPTPPGRESNVKTCDYPGGSIQAIRNAKMPGNYRPRSCE